MGCADSVSLNMRKSTNQSPFFTGCRFDQHLSPPHGQASVFVEQPLDNYFFSMAVHSAAFVNGGLFSYLSFFFGSCLFNSPLVGLRSLPFKP